VKTASLISRRPLVIILPLLTIGCLGRPSFSEAKAELADLINPARQAALQGTGANPDPSEQVAYCSDPFIGPSDGVRPTLRYVIPLASLGENSKVFVEEAENVWRDQGLEIESDESEVRYVLFATKRGFSLQASLNYENGEAIISGTGPCVDDPNPAK
jgi:hypothetical protein